MSIFRIGDYKVKNQKITPTQDKSHKVFCRNCNCQNTPTAKICVQCEVTMSPKPLRKKMK